MSIRSTLSFLGLSAEYIYLGEKEKENYSQGLKLSRILTVPVSKLNTQPVEHTGKLIDHSILITSAESKHTASSFVSNIFFRSQKPSSNNLESKFSVEITEELLPLEEKKSRDFIPVEDLDGISARLPQYSREVVNHLARVCRGSDNGCMKTLGLVETVDANQIFQVDGQTIFPSQETSAIDLERLASNPSLVSTPNFVEFCAEWKTSVLTSGEGNNILGDNVGLYCYDANLQVPVVEAKAETLAYYGAFLIPDNTALRFSNKEAYPIWKMHVGESYLEDYIMSEDGGKGLYLEFHHDQPHFHMIVDGGGYYLLAKQIEENTFHLTAFELTNGQAVYTKKGAIHCDATLKGDLIVGYALSNECSTALFRNKEDSKILQLNFVR